ncbi:MAG: Suppressor of sigma54-dependent transcription, PspA-like, partial [uncultured Solirubrobacteraceae bacterium]
GRSVRTLHHRDQGEDLEDARQGRGSGRDPRLQLHEAARVAAGRQEGHRRRRHGQEAAADAVVEARAVRREARRAGPHRPPAGQRGPRADRARAQDRRPDGAAVARPAGRRARGPAAEAHRLRAEAAHEDRGLPLQEGGHQGPVLRRRGAGAHLGGRHGRGRGDGRRRPGHAARRRQDGDHEGARERRGGARGRRHVRGPDPARLGPGRHRPPAAPALQPVPGGRRAGQDARRARRGRPAGPGQAASGRRRGCRV